MLKKQTNKQKPPICWSCILKHPQTMSGFPSRTYSSLSTLQKVEGMDETVEAGPKRGLLCMPCSTPCLKVLMNLVEFL